MLVSLGKSAEEVYQEMMDAMAREMAQDIRREIDAEILADLSGFNLKPNDWIIDWSKEGF